MGREGRLRVGPWPKLQHILRRRRELRILFSLQNARSTIAGPADGFRSADVVPYTSRLI
jgi:hypothetical protein